MFYELDIDCFDKLNQELNKNMNIIDADYDDDQISEILKDEGVEENKSDSDKSAEVPDATKFSDIHKMHMIQTLQGLLFIRSLEEVKQEEIERKKIFLPPPDDPMKKKVIVFDLDETLVHCIEDFNPTDVDHVLTIEFPNNEKVDAGLNIRPYAIE